MVLLVFAGCAKPTEEQRLSKLRGSMKVKAYRLGSENVTRLALVGYSAKTSEKVDADLIHATLGVVWFLAEKNEYSFIEADIIGRPGTNDTQLVSLALKSIALSKMKYPGLSKAHYDELKTQMAIRRNTDANSIEVEHKVCLLCLIAVSLYHGDPDLAKFSADALGAASQLDYLPPLIGAVVEAKKGSPLKAVEQLREMNKSERFSEHKRVLMTEIADIIQNCPDKEKLGEELMNRVLQKLVQRGIDDVFTADNQRLLLEKVKSLPGAITGKTLGQMFANDMTNCVAPSNLTTNTMDKTADKTPRKGEEVR
jgi:hypothetical protein